MTLAEARTILGLDPDEDPRPHLAGLREAREQLAALVREAPNAKLAARHQEELVEFDKALAAAREYLEALGLAVEPPPPDEPAPPAAAEESMDDAAATEEPAPTWFGRLPAWCAWLLVFFIGAAGGGVLYFNNEESKRLQRQERIAFLERVGTTLIENRRWPDAVAAFAEIETLAPGSDIARFGRRSIEAGIAEEQNQFIGYWTGQAIAELDAGRLDEAEAAIRQVLDKYPTHPEAAAIRQRIATARAGLARENSLTALRRLIAERQWEQAITAARRLLDADPADAAATALLADATAALEKSRADQTRARALYEQAMARDQGRFDQEALDWLREALALAPDDARIRALHEKMASYTRTLRVPGDFATPAEALAAARDGDRIVLAARSWQGPLVVNAAVDLQGAGPDQTSVECAPAAGSAITIAREAKGARISGIAFRHNAFLADGSERFSVALVRGGGATFTDCRFGNASGHGLAVIEQGEAIANRCRFEENGWNGAAAIGRGSFLEVRDSSSTGNFQNGIESWDGARVTLLNNRCEGNTRNGIHADNGTGAAVIEGNQLVGNREFGLVLGSAAKGQVTGNAARDNLLGGFVIRAAAAIPVTRNEATRNHGPGLVLETGLRPDDYISNKIRQNQPRDILTDADLSARDAAGQ